MDSGKIVKGSLNVVILQLLNNNGQMYGYEIVKAVRDASKGQTEITEAALYPALHRLEADEQVLITSKIVEGRQRKYYRLSRKGKKYAEQSLAELQSAITSLQKILKYHRK